MAQKQTFLSQLIYTAIYRRCKKLAIQIKKHKKSIMLSHENEKPNKSMYEKPSHDGV
jgi:ribosome-associated translation inhibitor RaiA